jgi:hypothetical protein
MPSATTPAALLDAGAISPADAAWLQERGAVDVRVGADGVIEFSARPIRDALTDAARDLLRGTVAPYLQSVAVTE